LAGTVSVVALTPEPADPSANAALGLARTATKENVPTQRKNAVSQRKTARVESTRRCHAIAITLEALRKSPNLEGDDEVESRSMMSRNPWSACRHLQTVFLILVIAYSVSKMF
jgi:hypothetical protein